MAKEIGVKQQWRLNLAALLAPIGMVAIPPEVSGKVREKTDLTKLEQDIINAFPETSRNFIGNIPRLKEVGDIVYYHKKNFNGSGFPNDSRAGQDISIESRILKILYDLATLTDGSNPCADHFNVLGKHPYFYDTSLLSVIQKILVGSSDAQIQTAVEVETLASMLRPGDILQTDLLAKDGRLVLAADIELSSVQIERIKGFVKLGEVAEPIKVIRFREGQTPQSETRWN